YTISLVLLSAQNTGFHCFKSLKKIEGCKRRPAVASVARAYFIAVFGVKAEMRTRIRSPTDVCRW
ncbi:MAG: hypothetical protein WBX29_07045, partial [Nitrososphaeraceae archaeon]